MQANSAEHQPQEHSSAILGVTSSYVDGVSSEPESLHDVEPIHFQGFYESCMEMHADGLTVGTYLNSHRDWFLRCASPMKADPLGENGYALTIGRFGALGYDVEPKIGLDLLPPDAQGVYRIETIAIPDYTAPGYEVDFKACLQLVESQSIERVLSPVVTQVQWELHLDVAIQFPRFIYALPRHLIQSTGDRLLNQIVRQVSRCLTYKVQEDFHSTRGIPFGKKRKKFWNRGSANEA